MNNPVLQVSRLRVELDSGAPIIEEVTLTVRRGEILGIVGESGCGKTTTALAILGYARPGARIVSGSINVCGEEMANRTEQSARALRGRLVSYVPQDATVSLNPAMRVHAQILEIIRARGVHADTDRQVRSALARVHLPATDEFAHRFPHQLSGGQQQRVALALALVGEPPLVVLDEPTTGLDVVTQQHILQEINRLRDETGTAMVYVTHDLAAVSGLADRLAVMYAGRVVEVGTSARMLSRPYHPYTYGLISAVPDYLSGRPLRGIGGVSAGISDRAAGCAFAPRCPQAVDRCRDQAPEPIEPRPGEVVRCFEWARTPPIAHDSTQADAAAQDMGQRLLVVESLSAVHSGRRGIVTAARDISFSIGVGETLALVGESGSGKTTIARCIAGLHPPSSGRILLSGVALARKARDRPQQMRRDLQIVFQNPYESLNPRRSIGEQIARPARQLRGLDRAAAREEVKRLLGRVRLPENVADRYATELSGGERQRVAIARALAAQPRLLVCDEITSSLDVSVQAAVIELLAELRETFELSLLFISHDLGVVASIADRALVLEQGQLREYGPVAELLRHPGHQYTKELVAAAPRLSQQGLSDPAPPRDG